MFDRTRAQLQGQIDAQQAVLAQAQAAAAVSQTQVDAADGALASAQGQLQGARGILADAQTNIQSEQAKRDSARTQRDAATQQLSDWADAEPDPLPNGHPNPQHHAWEVRLQALRQALDAAQSALDNAEGVVAAATTARDQAAADVNLAQGGVNAAQAAVTEAQRRLDVASTAVAAAAQERDRLSAVPAELEARAVRILAEPLNVDDVQQLADRELFEALTRRHERHDRMTHRLAVTQDRGATLNAQDAMADDLTALAVTIRSWPAFAGYPDLDRVATTLEQTAAGSQAQRSGSATARTDDLPFVASQLTAEAQRVQGLLATATAERDAASTRLQQDSDALAAVNANAPRR